MLASRISYVGELGWELYVPMEQAAQLWEALLEAGDAHGAVPVGIGVYGTTGRIEKGYRAFGFELDAERTIVEAGMQRPKVKAADFVGREAYLAQREAGAADGAVHADRRRPHLGVSGMKRYMLGGEPILTRDGGTLTDGHGHHPYVTTAGLGAVAGQARAARLPAAGRGARSATSSRCPTWRSSTRSTVGSVDATPLFDPGNERIRCMTNVLVCVKRVPDSSGEVLLTEDAPGRRRPVRRLHDERRTRSAPSSWPCRSPTATGGEATVLTARATPTPSSSCAPRWRSAAPRRPCVEADAADVRPGRRRPRDRRGGPRPRGRRARRTT